MSILLLSTFACGTRAASEVLASAREVRRLSPEVATEHRPVRLRGHLLLVTMPRNAIVIFDGQEGVYVGVSGQVGDDYRQGDLLEVEGVTDAGDFAPMVKASRIDRIGPGELPVPRRTSIAELNAGGFDAAWIELHGIVRSCVRTPRNRMPVAREEPPGGVPQVSSLITLAQGEDKMDVLVNAVVDPREIVDAEIRVRGVVFNVHNATRQFVRANLQVPNRSMIEVVAEPPAEPFAMPEQRIRDVLRFHPDGFTGHRVHVRGVVTAHKDQHTLWLRDGDRGMRVASAQAGNLEPGDEVEVIGFPDHGSYTPSLSDAIFRKVRSGPPPLPQQIAKEEEISQHDADLVQIDAELREVLSTAEGISLILHWRGLEITAVMERAGTAVPADWEPGSVLKVSGICLARSNNFFRPTGLWLANDLQLWLRSEADVAVLRPAPWLTARRALWLAIGVALAMLIALVAVALLARRQIAQREEARKLAEVEFSAMLAERNRLARELHDTLAQELNAISMQLELAKNAAKAGPAASPTPFLAAAHQMVRRCLAEARESIWDMRSHILEKQDLGEALRTVAERLRGGLACEIRPTVRGQVRRLAPAVENNLLRIGQEAVSNALKHAQPTWIEIALDYEPVALRLVVTNDGLPLDPDQPGNASRHFGLQGMRERAAQIDGRLQVGRDRAGHTQVDVRIETPEAI